MPQEKSYERRKKRALRDSSVEDRSNFLCSRTFVIFYRYEARSTSIFRESVRLAYRGKVIGAKRTRAFHGFFIQNLSNFLRHSFGSTHLQVRKLSKP